MEFTIYRDFRSLIPIRCLSKIAGTMSYAEGTGRVPTLVEIL